MPILYKIYKNYFIIVSSIKTRIICAPESDSKFDCLFPTSKINSYKNNTNMHICVNVISLTKLRNSNITYLYFSN
jgi:hypothetical protein